METSKTITSLAAAMLTLASAFAETDVIPLPDATKRQMQKEAENAESKRQASKAKAKPEKMQDIGQAKALATYAPRPQYPYEARSRHVTGRGVVVLRINAETGLVSGYKMARSTGSPILDNAALSAFRQWRFAPRRGPTILPIPVSFTMSGVQY
jgi:TonB family protein